MDGSIEYDEVFWRPSTLIDRTSVGPAPPSRNLKPKAPAIWVVAVEHTRFGEGGKGLRSVVL